MAKRGFMSVADEFGGALAAITGNDGNNLLHGTSGNDSLAGLGGDDTLLAGAGDDTLDGGTGNDRLVGAPGDDYFLVDSAGDTVIELAGKGNDTVSSTIDYVLGDNLECLYLEGNDALDGTGNALDNVLLGNAGANFLLGGAGNDSLAGFGGLDTLQGGTGDDVYYLDGAVVLVEQADEGRDLVLGLVDVTLGDNFEDLALLGGAALNGTGNGQDNVLLGNSGRNWLDGLAGMDTLAGGKGSDTFVTDGDDRIRERAGEGLDTVRITINHHLGANLENLVLLGSAVRATGNELDNRLVGNQLDNRMDGGTGKDTMAGGAGDDLYFVDQFTFGYVLDGDVVVEGLGKGQDTVQSLVSIELAENVETLVLLGTRGLEGSGNQEANLITGTVGNDTLDGGGNDNPDQAANGDDTIFGGDGKDNLYGGGGSDSLDGGAGDDVLDGDADYGGGEAADCLFGGLGNDVLWGRDGDTLDGGAGNDTLTSQGLGQVLIGGEGNDQFDITDLIVTPGGTIDGGAGRDVLLVASTLEGMVITGVETLMVYAYPIDVSAATLAGFSHIDLQLGWDPAWRVKLNITGSGTADIGRALGARGAEISTSDEGNIIRTGAGSDLFYSHSAGDRLNGGAGNDLFYYYDPPGGGRIIGGDGVDTLYLALPMTANEQSLGNLVFSGIETLHVTARTYGTAAQFEAFNTIANHLSDTYGMYLGLVGAGSVDLSGELDGRKAEIACSDLGNGVTTGGGMDTLTGGAGNDTLDGGGGVDLLSGGGGADRFAFDLADAASGTDQLADFTVGEDGIRLSGTGLAKGWLDPLAFRANATGQAEQAGDRVLFDLITGVLRFDADGSGSGAAVDLAVLTPDLVLGAGDFWIAG